MTVTQHTKHMRFIIVLKHDLVQVKSVKNLCTRYPYHILNTSEHFKNDRKMYF